MAGMYRRYALRLILAFWIASLASVPSLAGGAVLCVGSDGHVAIEASHAGFCSTENGFTGDRAGVGEHEHAELHDASCTDYPLDNGGRQLWRTMSKAGVGAKAPSVCTPLASPVLKPVSLAHAPHFGSWRARAQLLQTSVKTIVLRL